MRLRKETLRVIILDSLRGYFFSRRNEREVLEGEVDKIHTYNICSLHTHTSTRFSAHLRISDIIREVSFISNKKFPIHIS